MSGADSVMKALAGWGGLELRINPMVKPGTAVREWGRWSARPSIWFHCEADKREWLHRFKSVCTPPRVKKGRGQRRNRRNR